MLHAAPLNSGSVWKELVFLAKPLTQQEFHNFIHQQPKQRGKSLRWQENVVDTPLDGAMLAINCFLLHFVVWQRRSGQDAPELSTCDERGTNLLFAPLGLDNRMFWPC